jgi:hypothetical protein
MPFVMAIGIGISVRNAIAVLEAIFGKESEFARTPKHGIEGTAGRKKGTSIQKSYHNRSGWLPYLEVALGCYFAAAVVYAFQNENYATIPFLLLFVWGYLYTGAMSLGQAWFERLKFRGAVQPAAPEIRPAASGAPGF